MFSFFVIWCSCLFAAFHHSNRKNSGWKPSLQTISHARTRTTYTHSHTHTHSLTNAPKSTHLRYMLSVHRSMQKALTVLFLTVVVTFFLFRGKKMMCQIAPKPWHQSIQPKNKHNRWKFSPSSRSKQIFPLNSLVWRWKEKIFTTEYGIRIASIWHLNLTNGIL